MRIGACRLSKVLSTRNSCKEGNSRLKKKVQGQGIIISVSYLKHGPYKMEGQGKTLEYILILD